MKRFTDSLARLDDAVARRAPAAELDSLHDRVFEAFSRLPEEARPAAREAYCGCAHFGSSDYYDIYSSYFLRFREHGRPEDLRRAAAHYVMNDGRPDLRDAVLGLGDLLVHGRRHGVDTRAVFRELAPLASTEHQLIGSMRGYLEQYGGAAEPEVPSEGLILYMMLPPDHALQEVAVSPGEAALREAVEHLKADGIAFVLLRRDEQTWLEVSGNTGADGLSARCMDAGEELVIARPPDSLEECLRILSSYAQGDGWWRDEYDWE